MEWLYQIIGSDPRTIVWWQMCIRAFFIFFVGLILVRFGGKRAFGKITSFDIVVAVILGSILSRALTANARFFPTLAASAVLMSLHLLLGKLAFRSRWFGHIIKGVETELIKDGTIQWKEMRQSNITLHDLHEAARLKGVLDMNEVQTAILERNGSVSIFRKGE